MHTIGLTQSPDDRHQAPGRVPQPLMNTTTTPQSKRMAARRASPIPLAKCPPSRGHDGPRDRCVMTRLPGRSDPAHDAATRAFAITSSMGGWSPAVAEAKP
jgi:hypothetical protein